MSVSRPPASFRHIHLELARESDHPAGDNAHGYDILAPLTADGFLDAEEWRAHRDKCRVRRFRPDDDDLIGRLKHSQGGKWYIDYDPDRDDDDERALHFENEQFRPGEYVAIRENDGTTHTFRVVAVRMLD
ncbi:MAG: hypothetical protein GVY06_06085 [Alphaproteobacteria bacterium]|nr:hypothetical protein [Alphaproteobacteria bacterium]